MEQATVAPTWKCHVMLGYVAALCAALVHVIGAVDELGKKLPDIDAIGSRTRVP